MSKSKSSKPRPKQAKPAPKTAKSTKPKVQAKSAKPSSNRRSVNTPVAHKVKPLAKVRRELSPGEIAYKNSLERFESALQSLSQGQISRARTAFEKLAADPVRELAERARVYLHICDQRLAKPAPQLKTAEDFYNQGVGLANEGDPDQAEEYLRKALKLAPDLDYIYYALATTFAQRENLEGALENLQKAIELNERNRYQAQNDSDFSNLLEDPRFTELLYPEKPSG